MGHKHEAFVVELWGRDLMDEFAAIYRERSRFACVFVSVQYLAKPWPRHERRNAQARSLTSEEPYILPVQLDDSILPGVPPTTAHVDGRKNTPEEIAEMLIKKLGGSVTEKGQAQPIGVPRTPEAVAELIATREGPWEYLLFAGYLAQGKQRLDRKWRDHELGLAQPGQRRLTDEESLDALKSFEGPLLAIQNFDRLMAPEAQEGAFGAPGEPGDPEAIEHLATRYLDVYEYLMDWATTTRSLGVTEGFRPLRDITARMSDKAIERIREAIDIFIAELEQASERLAKGEEGIRVEHTITLEVDDDVAAAHQAELDRLLAEGF